MAIFIRHAHDKKQVGDKMYDTSVTETGRREAIYVCKQLLQRYGRPDVIYCSPFRRARQTAKIMAEMLNNTVPIYVDVELSRFAGDVTSYEKKIREDTKKYGYIPGESNIDFKNRVKKNVETAVQYTKKNSNHVAWFITHAIYVKQAAKRVNVKPNRFIHSCDWVALHDSAASWRQ